MSYDVLVLVGQNFWKNDNIQEGI